jgi:hypothetical protein
MMWLCLVLVSIILCCCVAMVFVKSIDGELFFTILFDISVCLLCGVMLVKLIMEIMMF